MFHPLSHTPTALPSTPLETTASFSTSVYLTLFHLSPVPHGGRIVIRDVTSCSCLVSNSKMFLRLGHLAIKDRRFSLEDWLVFNRSYVIMFSPFVHSFIYHSSFMLSLVTRFSIFAVVNRRLDILLEIRDFISCGKAKSMVILFLIDFHKDYIKLYYLQEHTGLLCECLTPSPPTMLHFCRGLPLGWWERIYGHSEVYICQLFLLFMYCDGSPKLSTWWHIDSPGGGGPLSTPVRDCLH